MPETSFGTAADESQAGCGEDLRGVDDVDSQQESVDIGCALRNCLEQRETRQQQEWCIDCGATVLREVVDLDRQHFQNTHLRTGRHHSDRVNFVHHLLLS
jgi:hypothetical protein